MFRVNVFSFKYFILKANISEQLNLENFSSLSKSKINLIRQQYDSYYFNVYIRNLLDRWYKENFKLNEYSLNKLKRIIGKYEIELSPKEKEDIWELESENLTNERAFKTLHTILDDDEKFANKKCFFYYKDVKFYKDVDGRLKLVANIDLYYLNDSLLFYDKKAQGQVNIITYKSIKDVKKEGYGIRISSGPTTSILRYDNKNIIYISLIRVIKKFDSHHSIFWKNH